MDKYRIVLADDHRLFVQGLVTLLESEPDFEVVGVANNGDEIIEIVKDLHPDLIIMDVDMPKTDGIKATKDILSINPDMKIVALSMHDGKHHVLHMLEAGAKGYILKDAVFEDLANALRVIINGESFLSPKIASLILKEVSNRKQMINKKEKILTTREQQVLKEIVDGKKNKEIGKILFISDKTVENHRKNIMTKLDIHSIAELTKFAIRNKLTDL